MPRVPARRRYGLARREREGTRGAGWEKGQGTPDRQSGKCPGPMGPWNLRPCKCPPQLRKERDPQGTRGTPGRGSTGPNCRGGDGGLGGLGAVGLPGEAGGQLGGEGMAGGGEDPLIGRRRARGGGAGQGGPDFHPAKTEPHRGGSVTTPYCSLYEAGQWRSKGKAGSIRYRVKAAANDVR